MCITWGLTCFYLCVSFSQSERPTPTEALTALLQGSACCMAKFRAGVGAAMWQLEARAPTHTWALTGSRHTCLPGPGPGNHTAPSPLPFVRTGHWGPHARPRVFGPTFVETACARIYHMFKSPQWSCRFPPRPCPLLGQDFHTNHLFPDAELRSQSHTAQWTSSGGCQYCLSALANTGAPATGWG